MIVDSSALVAILTQEPEGTRFRQLLADAEWPRMSAANHVETAVALMRRYGRTAIGALEAVCRELDVETVPVTPAHARVAEAGYARFGRGSGSPARLNFGDCLAYALAITTGEPLLFKGADFTHTDVRPAWLPDGD